MPSTEVSYCQVCSLPHEFCEFGPSPDKCRAMLAAADGKLYEKVYGDQEVPDLAALTLKEKEKEQQKQTRKKQPQKVTIKREARTKRKCMVIVGGLHHFGIDLKKTAKMFAGKFACGASVTTNAAGQDEIVVQGDVEYEIEELILSQFPQISPEDVDNISK